MNFIEDILQILRDLENIPIFFVLFTKFRGYDLLYTKEKCYNTLIH